MQGMIAPEEERPETKDKEQIILDILWDIYERISRHNNNKEYKNMLEQYNYFIRKSTSKRDCTYAIKSRRLFMQYDYKDILNLLDKLNKELDNGKE